MNHTIKTLTAAVALLVSANAYATPQHTGQYGDWVTSAGTSNDGTSLMCVASLRGGERNLHINYSRGKLGESVAVQLYKTGWKIPKGTKVHIVMQVDQAPQMNLIAFAWHNPQVGQDFIHASIGARDIWDETGKPMVEELISLIGTGKKVTFYFPDGNEAPWEGSLYGSQAAMIKTAECIVALSAAVDDIKPKATQPFTITPTQPFVAPKPSKAPLAERSM